MDYNKVLDDCNARADLYQKQDAVWNFLHERQCADAITSLQARAEKAENCIREIEKALGDNFSLNRLYELMQADADGRIAVFPCKPSDTTVYQLRSKKHALGVGVSPRHVYCATVWAGGHYQLEHQGFDPCRDHDFGKTWFLDEKSANDALRGENDHGL